MTQTINALKADTAMMEANFTRVRSNIERRHVIKTEMALKAHRTSRDNTYAAAAFGVVVAVGGLLASLFMVGVAL